MTGTKLKAIGTMAFLKNIGIFICLIKNDKFKFELLVDYKKFFFFQHSLSELVALIISNSNYFIM